jgi:hypothetical protein
MSKTSFDLKSLMIFVKTIFMGLTPKISPWDIVTHGPVDNPSDRNSDFLIGHFIGDHFASSLLISDGPLLLDLSRDSLGDGPLRAVNLCLQF